MDDQGIRWHPSQNRDIQFNDLFGRMPVTKNHREETIKTFNNLFGPFTNEQKLMVGKTYDDLIKSFGGLMINNQPKQTAMAIAAGIISAAFKTPPREAGFIAAASHLPTPARGAGCDENNLDAGER